jgi:hypothetical protein
MTGDAAARLAPIERPNGKPYRPRSIRTAVWEDDDAWSEWRGGAVVMGTHDVEAARPLATAAIRRHFDAELVAANPEVGWWRLSFHFGELRWMPDEQRGPAGVMFTAVEVGCVAE